MSLVTKLASFLRSPSGQRMTRKAMDYAKSPEGKRKIAQTRDRVASQRRPKRLG